ncbi:hypothetical protein EsH8_IX_000389 [Colletotrichum jinshuiense]
MDSNMMSALASEFMLVNSLEDSWDTSSPLALMNKHFKSVHLDTAEDSFLLPRALNTPKVTGSGPAAGSSWDFRTTTSHVATRPESQVDWDAKKERLKALYLDDNLPLKEIMDVMLNQDSFLATERMYKRQFNKWNWRKYNTKGLRQSRLEGETVETCRGTTTCRRPARRQLRNAWICANGTKNRPAAKSLYRLSRHAPTIPHLLLHGNQHHLWAETVFASLRDLIEGNARINIDWKNSNRFAPLGSYSRTPFNLFRLASDLFDIEDYINSGLILRQAFREIEYSIEESDIIDILELLIEIPYNLLVDRSEVELQLYWEHLSRMLSVKRPGQPMTLMAMAIRRLVAEDCDRFFDLLAQISVVISDYYTAIRPQIDVHVIRAKADVVFYNRHIEKSSAKCADILEMYENLLEYAISEFSDQSNEVLYVASTIVVAACEMDAPLDTVIKLGQRSCDLIRSANSISMDNWDELSLERYGRTNWHLHDQCSVSGDTGMAISYLLESIAAMHCCVRKAKEGPNRNNAEIKLTRYRADLIELLRYIGKIQEADEVRAAVDCSQFLKDVPQEIVRERNAVECA